MTHFGDRLPNIVGVLGTRSLSLGSVHGKASEAGLFEAGLAGLSDRFAAVPPASKWASQWYTASWLA